LNQRLPLVLPWQTSISGIVRDAPVRDARLAAPSTKADFRLSIPMPHPLRHGRGQVRRMKGLPPSLMLPEMSQTKWSIMALPHSLSARSVMLFIIAVICSESDAPLQSISLASLFFLDRLSIWENTAGNDTATFNSSVEAHKVLQLHNLLLRYIARLAFHDIANNRR
jgi:hypothetical protein